MDEPLAREAGTGARRFPVHGRVGVALVVAFWALNWSLPGLRTHLCFFPLWLGYCLTVDGLAVFLRGTSLLTRSRALYASLFVVSAPAWWLFEAINLRTANWRYVGREAFTDLEYAVLATLSFSTVIPAVLGTAELFARARERERRPSPDAPARTTLGLMAGTGAAMFALLMIWPRWFFPLVWLSVFFVLDPINATLGNRSILEWIRRGRWRPVLALFAGALTCGFFWELWNWRSYPKWVYDVPIFGFAHLFEMPALGYLGYLPFALELFALVHLAMGFAGRGRTDFVTRGLDP